ncbi:hypothetical protein BDF21DRAFT_456886 [Thamnidium elegans]|uniref:Uncharacterized protein n=1 Tax=Thamnidium elegans TaxID=101142 RepID=A0A8H7SRV1_9FUNG|nr:hypothetical protein INT48_006501 [Thamnidium elegans]KAI8050058.1 hypothetical protein BDF21DRAFT_456886 [Thamnidium elegans]
MLSIILFYLVASVSCFPFSNVFHMGCLEPIEQELNIAQGLKPDLLNTATNFGYVYRLDTPTLRLGPDITVLDISETYPPQAAVILSSMSYNEFDTRLVLRGQMSKLNWYRINRLESLEGTLMTIRFDTFSYNKKDTWYARLGSSHGGITGRISNFDIQQEQDIMIELVPEPNTFHDEYLEFKTVPNGNVKRIDWTASGKHGCRTNRQVNNKVDQFDQVFDSAVLL